jgi:hypothetical protein
MARAQEVEGIGRANAAPASHVVRDPDHLEELLLAGVNSGPAVEATPEYWSDLRLELESRAECRRAGLSDA